MPTIALAPVVSLDGSSLADAWQAALIELRVEHQYQVPSRCTLRFSDPGYTLAEQASVSLGTTVSVADAANSDLVLIAAEVTSVGVEQRVGEQPELVVVAHDKSHRLGQSSNVKTFQQMTYSDIVSQLASDSDLEIGQIDTTSDTLDVLLQVDTDLGLLTELARRVGYDWWVDAGKLYFAKPTEGTTVDLTLGEDLLSFSARASGHHPSAVTVSGWDRSKQQQVTATADSPTSAVMSSSTIADLAESPPWTASLTSGNLNAHTDSEATELSQAILDSAAAASVTAQGLAVGNGNIKIDTTATVAQAGPLSGTYPVTRVEHLFRPRSGYLTRFFAGDRRPRSLVDSLDGSRVSATPATTMHPGVYIGQVSSVKDPNNEGRVQVYFPGLSTSSVSDWSRVLAVGGGASRGNFFLPEVNDEVLVAFEGGDPREAVVLGGLYGPNSTIPEGDSSVGIVDNSSGTILQRTMTSRLGHMFSFLDGKEDTAQAIVLQLAGGNNTIQLGKDKLSITVPSGTPIEVTAGDSSIKIANDGSLTLSAKQISITGTAKIALSAPEIDISADTQLNLSSDTATSLKGATLEVQSEGPLSMTGEPISLN